jgi:hypothetical protein
MAQQISKSVVVTLTLGIALFIITDALIAKKSRWNSP